MWAMAASMFSMSLPPALVELAQFQHNYLDATRGQCLDRGADVLGIPAKAVELRYHQRLAVADLAEHLSELRTQGRRDLARHVLIGMPEIDCIAGHLDLIALVLRRRFLGTDPTIFKIRYVVAPYACFKRLN